MSWIWPLMGLGGLLALLGYGLGRAAAKPPLTPPERPLEPDEPASPPPPPEPTLWAAYSGYWAGSSYRPVDVALFHTEFEAGVYATRLGMYVTRVRLGRDLFNELRAASVAPVVPWDEPP